MSEPVTTSSDALERVRTISVLVLAVIATGAALQALGDVMIPFALSMFLAIALAPVVDWLSDKTRLSRAVSVAITMVLGVLVLAVLGGIVALSIDAYDSSFGAEVAAPSEPAAESESTEEAAEAAADELQALVTGWLEPFGMQEHAGTVAAQVRAFVPKLMGLLGTLLSQGITVMIFLMFLLVEQGRAGASSGGVGGTVRDRVKQYISVKVLTSAVTGIAVGLSLWAIGVPAAVLFGLFTFLLNFIPTIGSIIAIALPLLLLFMEQAPVVTIVLALVIPGAIQFAVGQVWENKLLGDKFDLRASVVLLALVFWGKIWGIVGMLLATPITAVLKTLMEGLDLTRPLARMLGQATEPPK